MPTAPPVAYGPRAAPVTAESVVLIEAIEAMGVAMQELIDRLADYVEDQYHAGTCPSSGSEEELNRLDRAEPHKWLAAGKQNVQIGLTEMIRAVVQPAGMC